jgi:hypothetical protein
MRRIFVFCAAALLVIAGAIYAFGDIAHPKTSPSPEQPKAVFYTGLTVMPDAKASEARLQISQETLKQIRDGAANTGGTESMTQRLMHSSTRTIMAGLFMFLAVSFAGVWLARTNQRRHPKAVAAVVLIAALLGVATAIVRANAGPPGYIRWQNLPQALKDGKETVGGVSIEIVPGDDNMKLIIPFRKSNSQGE